MRLRVEPASTTLWALGIGATGLSALAIARLAARGPRAPLKAYLLVVAGAVDSASDAAFVVYGFQLGAGGSGRMALVAACVALFGGAAAVAVGIGSRAARRHLPFGPNAHTRRRVDLLLLAVLPLDRELLRFLPWSSNDYDGLPTARVLAGLMLCETSGGVVQLVLQGNFLLSPTARARSLPLGMYCSPVISLIALLLRTGLFGAHMARHAGLKQAGPGAASPDDPQHTGCTPVELEQEKPTLADSARADGSPPPPVAALVPPLDSPGWPELRAAELQEAAWRHEVTGGDSPVASAPYPHSSLGGANTPTTWPELRADLVPPRYHLDQRLRSLPRSALMTGSIVTSPRGPCRPSARHSHRAADRTSDRYRESLPNRGRPLAPPNSPRLSPRQPPSPRVGWPPQHLMWPQQGPSALPYLGPPQSPTIPSNAARSARQHWSRLHRLSTAVSRFELPPPVSLPRPWSPSAQPLAGEARATDGDRAGDGDGVDTGAGVGSGARKKHQGPPSRGDEGSDEEAIGTAHDAAAAGETAWSRMRLLSTAAARFELPRPASLPPPSPSHGSAPSRARLPAPPCSLSEGSGSAHPGGAIDSGGAASRCGASVPLSQRPLSPRSTSASRMTLLDTERAVPTWADTSPWHAFVDADVDASGFLSLVPPLDSNQARQGARTRGSQLSK